MRTINIWCMSRLERKSVRPFAFWCLFTQYWRCCLVKYWKRGMHRKMESLYSHDKRLHPTGWSMTNSALLKLVIDELRHTKVKLQPTFPGWRAVIPAKRLPCLGCLAHGKSGVWPLKTGRQASCIVAAQRGRAGHTDKKDRDKQKGVRKRDIYTHALQTLSPLSNFVTGFNGVSDSPDNHQEEDLALAISFSRFNSLKTSFLCLQSTLVDNSWWGRLWKGAVKRYWKSPNFGTRYLSWLVFLLQKEGSQDQCLPAHQTGHH